MDSFVHTAKFFNICLVVFYFMANVAGSDACPSMCICGKYGGSMPYVNCEKRNLREFPGNISRSTELLRFRQNEITRLPKNFPTLLPNTKTLSIEENKIEFLADGVFSNLPSLHEIFISYNKIKSIGKHLFAKSAPGSEIRFYLEGNLLENVADEVFKNCSATFFVNWKSNLIKTLRPGVFAGAEGIFDLNLEHNRIDGLASGVFKDLTKMYYLGLGNNSLSSIASGVFQGLHRLEILTLQKNRISSLASDVFKDLSVVKEINLESNLFTELPIEAIRMLPSFSKIKLKNNPIKCTCKLKSDLSDESIKNKIADLKDIRCSNLNKTIEEAIKDVNCVTETAPTSTAKTTTRAKFQSTTEKSANEVKDPTSSTKRTASKKDVYTKKNPENDSYENQTPLPLIIGVAIGSFIIVVVIILFVYLYRRPIARRAVSTMSLPRKKSNSNRSEPKKDIFYQRSPFNDYSTDYNI